jgi:hypothetical protein
MRGCMVKKIERWDKLVSYGLVVLVLWGLKSRSSAVEGPQGHTGRSVTAEIEKVYPSGKIDGFFVYIVKGLPDDPKEPLLTLTLTPIGEPNCNIVWSLVGQPSAAVLYHGPMGCKGPYRSRAYYERKLYEAIIMYSSGLKA